MKKLTERPEWQMSALAAAASAATSANPPAIAAPPSAGNPSPPSTAPPAANDSAPPASASAPTTKSIDPQEALAGLKAAGLRLVSQPNLIVLVRTMGTSFGPEHAPLLAGLPRLQTLDLSQHQACGEVLKALPSLPALQTLILDNSPVSDADLAQLTKFPSLQRLSLQRTRVAGPGLENLRHLPTLKSLTLPQDFPRQFVPLICLAKGLETCTLWPRGMTDADLESLAALPNLRSVDLRFADLQGSGLVHLQRLTRLDSVRLPDRPPAEVLRQVANLNLSQMTFPAGMTAAEVALFARMPRLRIVTMPTDFTDQHLEELTKFPAIEDLTISPSQITEDGLAALANAKTLRTVSLPATFTDRGAAQLAKASQLTAVRAAQCAGLTDRGVTELAKISGLKELTLGAGVGDGCIGPIAQHSTLEDLTFDKSRLSSRAIEGLSQAKSLRHLSLFRVTVDDAGLEALKKLRQLRFLNLSQAGVTLQQFQAVREALPPTVSTGFSN